MKSYKAWRPAVTAAACLLAAGLLPAAGWSAPATASTASGGQAPALSAPRGKPLTLAHDQQVALGLRFLSVSAAQAPTLSLAGTVVVPPDRQAVVAAPVPGLLTDVRVAVGDRVVSGQTLARLSSPRLIELQREAMQALVQRDLARDTLARDERLHSEGLIAQARLRAARARLTEAEALADERRSQLKLAGATHPGSIDPALGALAPIVAPVSGIVLEATALNGQRVEAATALFRIAHGSVLWLDLQASPEQAAAIALGDRVTWPARGVSGKVSAIGAAVGAGQTVSVRAPLDAGGHPVRPGETLQAQVRVRLPAGAQWRVPATAVTRLQGRTVVFAQHPQGVRVVEVIVHGRDDEGVMIAGALQTGDRVAVAGVPGLKALASEEQP